MGKRSRPMYGFKYLFGGRLLAGSDGGPVDLSARRRPIAVDNDAGRSGGSYGRGSRSSCHKHRVTAGKFAFDKLARTTNAPDKGLGKNDGGTWDNRRQGMSVEACF